MMALPPLIEPRACRMIVVITVMLMTLRPAGWVSAMGACLFSIRSVVLLTPAPDSPPSLRLGPRCRKLTNELIAVRWGRCCPSAHPLINRFTPLFARSGPQLSSSCPVLPLASVSVSFGSVRVPPISRLLFLSLGWRRLRVRCRLARLSLALPLVAETS